MQPPTQTVPDPTWEHYDVFMAVQRALHILPTSFKSEIVLTGVLATDLFTFNTSLGATIEISVVEALNSLRSVWDASQQYSAYIFRRSAQSFPDVVLRSAIDNHPLLGIELKGWYLFAKEAEPSFRYRITPAVCTDADLLVIYPWALSHVVSGSPILFPPFVTGAKYAAEYRNWHWEHGRRSTNSEIRLSQATTPYPSHAEAVADEAANDKGGNFGRVARTGLMDDYITNLLYNNHLSGIPLFAWQRFLSIFAEGRTPPEIEQDIDKIAKALQAKRPTPDKVGQIAALIGQLMALLRGD